MILRKSSQLVVKHHNPVQYVIIIAVIVIAVFIGGWYLLNTGRGQAGFDFNYLETEYEALKSQHNLLEKENRGLREEVASLTQGGKIEEQAYGEVRNSLTDLQDEILELKEEVAFYRSIVTPGESSKGLRIQKFDIENNGQKQGYRYKLVLTQVIKNNNITRGDINIAIEGVHGVEPRELLLTDVSTSKSNTLHFKFKYFQSFEGDIRLPEDFIASRIKLTIKSNQTDIEKIVKWPIT